MQLLLRRFLALAVPLAASAASAPTTSFAASAAALSSSTATSFVSASDPRFVYEGRFDQSDPSAPVVIWQGSRIRLDFDGDSLALEFTAVKDQVFFNAAIDGHSTIVGLRENQPPAGVAFSGLGAGRHQLVLFKRSEATAGTVQFRGVTLTNGAKAFAPTVPTYVSTMLFIGDSITAAACNEDGDTDQWNDRRTHNNALSYGAFTAAAFDADYRNIAVSGMGVVTGWTPMKAGEVWDRIYPRPDSPRENLASWTPKIVFVNLGENDDSFTTAKKLAFPADAFSDGYVELVHAIRQAYPHAEIVVLRGGMFGGAQSERLRGPWENAVKRIEAADPHASHFVFKHWSHNHPRVADHRAMADELIAWLKTQAFMRTHD